MTRKVFTHEERVAMGKKGRTPLSVLDHLESHDDVVFPIVDFVDGLKVKHRLTEGMQRFLMWRLKFATDSACARAVGLSPHSVHRWKQAGFDYKRTTVPDFNAAYAELFQRNRELAEKSMSLLGIRTVEVASELLNATKKNIVPRGEGQAPEIIETPDYENRYRGAQVVSNWMGEWGSKVPTQSNPTYIAIVGDFQELLELKKRKLLAEGVVVDGEVVSDNR